MKKVVLSIVFMAFAFGAGAQTSVNGSIHSVPMWIWVEVQNFGGPSTSACGIAKGREVEVIGQYDKNNVLCRYIVKDRDQDTECKAGSVFVMNRHELERFEKWNGKLRVKDNIRAVKIGELLNEYNN